MLFRHHRAKQQFVREAPSVRRLGFLVCLIIPLLVWATTASAAFPGKNGLIVFVKNGGNGTPLVSVNPDGSGLRKVTRGHYDSRPDVAPDGRAIAFSRDAKIFTVHMTGRHLKRLTSDDGSEPAFSGPLGRRIAFTRFNSVSSQIWVMASDGTAERRLTKPPTADRFPAFSPDGEWIAFNRDDRNRDERMYRMDSDGSGIRPLTHGVQPAGPASFSPDGEHIVFDDRSRNGNWVIYVMSANGNHVRHLRVGEDPAFSPNGKRVVFARHEVIYTMNRRGHNVRRVSPRSWTASEPDWAVRPANG